MSRVGLVSCHDALNYGARLQIFALQQAVEQLGHEGEILDYIIPERRAEAAQKKWTRNELRKGLVRVLSFGKIDQFYRNFARFTQERFHLTPRLDDQLATSETVRRFDAFICGSDQIWRRSCWNVWYLDFVPAGAKKIAYAPSFGVAELPDSEKEPIRRHLESFDAISIREFEGQKIIRELTAREVPVTLDPTLLLTAQQWEREERAPKTALPDQYVFMFTVQNTMPCFKMAQQIASHFRLPLVVIDIPRRLFFHPMLRKCYQAGPAEFLYLIHHAKFVVTTSFHGTAFSINYRKPFVTICQNATVNTNSRLLTLAKRLGLEDRFIYPGGTLSRELLTLDYAPVEDKLAQAREDSLEYLRQALS